MATCSPSPSSSRESTPVDYDDEPASKPAPLEHVSEAETQNSAFLRLPVDIFKCVTDYLDRDAAACLKRLCRGMSRSQVVDELLFRHPIQADHVKDVRRLDWKYRLNGLHRWNNFKKAVNDSNRHYVQKIAMSHWCSIADFQWIQDNLPSLISLELAAIKDFVWTPEETWTWAQLADNCAKLFAQIEELEVSNWADYNAHSRIEYSYAYQDYRFRQKFRLSRRRDGGSVAKIIFPLCARLKTLSIQERYSGFHTWNEWEVHQRVCSLVDGIVNHCPSTLRKLRVHDYAPYRSLFSTDATAWQNLTDLEIGLFKWMDDRRDRDILGPVPYRITPGNHHRDEEEAFDDKTYDSCDRNHMELGNHVVQGVTASLEDLLLNLRTITRKYPNIRIKPIATHKDIVLLPFHLINVTQRRAHHWPQHNNNPQQNAQNPQLDPIANRDIQESLRWLVDACGWRPVLAWDSMMCDVFPDNLEPMRTLLPKADVITRIQTMLRTLRSLSIPIRMSVGDRTGAVTSAGLDGCLYFGDYKCFVREDDCKQELLAPTQARFNLASIAELVDELTIHYPLDCPGVSGFTRAGKRPSEAEKELLRKEMKGWRKFWMRYALLFKNLKKLTITVPNDIYNDWGKCQSLASLLSDERWEMLDVDDQDLIECPLGPYHPYSHIKAYSFSRKRPRMKFVQRVFFRGDKNELLLNPQAMSEEKREEHEISEEMIATVKDRASHRFWPPRPPKPEKRKVEEEENDEARSAKRMRAD